MMDWKKAFEEWAARWATDKQIPTVAEAFEAGWKAALNKGMQSSEAPPTG
jgi:hypothetical protein